MEQKTYIDPEYLAKGKELCALKVEFNVVKTQEALTNVFICMRNMKVLLPLRPSKDSDIGTKHDIVIGDRHFSPDTIQAQDGSGFLAVFSQPEEIPEAMAKVTTFRYMDTVECVEMAHDFDGFIGIVLDPYTERLVLPFEVADQIKNMPIDAAVLN